MKLPDVDLKPAAVGRPGDRRPVTVAEIAAESPVIVDPEVHRVRSERRVRLAINHLPESYKKLFEERAAAEGITFKALLIDMMRAYGFRVPSADQIDGRFRG